MKLSSLLLIAGLGLGISSHGADDKPLQNQKDKASYGLGVNVGKRFRSELIELDIDSFMRGFKDAIAGKDLALSDAELTQAMEALRKDVESKAGAQAEENKKKGQDFLAQNKTKEGVKTLPSGLQYKVLKDGTGAIPKETDTVTVNYKGTLTDGTEFDSSYKRGEPATFPVKGVIPGWTEALQKMKTGSKWQLTIPPSLAYGDDGQGPIPPNSVLLFEVELLSIGEPKAAKK